MKKKNKETLVVNFFAGPGAGKSTMARDVCSELKWDGIDAEMAHEYMKDLVWERRAETFKNQIYLFSKQHHRIFCQLDKVTVCLTDSPLLLSLVYTPDGYEHLNALAISEYNKCRNLNFFVTREKKYNPNGRNQTEKESKVIDQKILKMLRNQSIDYAIIPGTKLSVPVVADLIKARLDLGK